MLLALTGCSGSRPVAPSHSDLAHATSTQLADDKTRLEIQQLTDAIKQNHSLVDHLMDELPLLTALVAVLTFGVGWAKQRSDTREAQAADENARAKEIDARYETQYATAAASLSSTNANVQAGAAAMLPLYLRSGDAAYCERMTVLIVSQLQIGVPPIVERLLVDTLGRAIARLSEVSALDTISFSMHGAALPKLAIRNASFRPASVDVSAANLTGAQLVSVTLFKLRAVGATITDVDLHGSNFGQAAFDRVTGLNARFDGCRMVAAGMRGADLRHASFRGASLQSAHFDGADLRGAHFEGANLNDCYFVGARLDTGAAASIRRTTNWRQGHFDALDFARIESSP